MARLGHLGTQRCRIDSHWAAHGHCVALQTLVWAHEPVQSVRFHRHITWFWRLTARCLLCWVGSRRRAFQGITEAKQAATDAGARITLWRLSWWQSGSCTNGDRQCTRRRCLHSPLLSFIVIGAQIWHASARLLLPPIIPWGALVRAGVRTQGFFNIGNLTSDTTPCTP